MAQPFVALNDSPAHFSYSPATSYLRDNIAFPTGAGILGGVVAAGIPAIADTAFEDRLPAGQTTASEPTPATA